ncbi:GNAT family N-acetyltransferase [Brevibacillus dissolubilis]|uniref:GNAT family N-acetyltransferase n=1 Tax=Brevibacillus dissolubilis TaxID=1844116 RepID=UPI0011167755|nr:GNAT family N-acetyltransferase [Brevibacillus dissolubilis]
MTDNQVELVALHSENWYECCKLQVANEQIHYIEPNAVSIAQSKFEPTLQPYAIYSDGKPVGFLMYNTVEEELGGYWIYRIMVDQHAQGQGIGLRAAELMIQQMAALPGCQRIVVGYHPENQGADRLYARLGFVDKGDRFGKEMAVILDL